MLTVELLAEAIDFLFLQVGQDDPRTFLHIFTRHRPPDALCGASYDGYFILEL